MDNKYIGKVLCSFSVSDNEENLGAAVEHGDTFENTKFYIKISNH